MRLSELFSNIKTLVSDQELTIKEEFGVKVEGISVDSRKIGKNWVFVACQGASSDSQDGHLFINNAINQGACAVVVSQGSALPKNNKIPIFVATNSRIAAAKLIEKFWGNPSKKIKICGITGTNGKTTVSVLAASILSGQTAKPAILGTLGYGCPSQPKKAIHTTPEAEIISPILSHLSESGFSHVFMEISSHGLATYRADGLDFELAAFTNMSQDHLDFHGDLKSYAQAKERLFIELLPPSKTAILPFGHKLCQTLKGRNHIITWGKCNKADIFCHYVDLTTPRVSLVMSIYGKKVKVVSQLIGDFNIDNILTAAAIASALDATPKQIAKGISNAKTVPGRCELVATNLKKAPYVVVDFAHTPEALEKILETMLKIKGHGHLILVFGCGGNRDSKKRPIMGDIASRLADQIIITNDNPRDENPEHIAREIWSGISAWAKKSVTIILDRKKAIKKAIQEAKSNDIVLIAGKGDESTQEKDKVKLPFKDAQIAKEILMEYYHDYL